MCLCTYLYILVYFCPSSSNSFYIQVFSESDLQTFLTLYGSFLKSRALFEIIIQGFYSFQCIMVGTIQHVVVVVFVLWLGRISACS